MVQFVHMLGLQVTLATHRPIEGLLFRSRAVSDLGFRDPLGRSPSANAVGSTRGDGGASQSRYSLPTVTSLIAASVGEGATDTSRMSVEEPSVSQSVNVAETPDLEDVPFAVLVQQEELRNWKGKKKNVELWKLSREGMPDPVPKRGKEEVGWVFVKEMLQRVPWVVMIFGTGPDDPLQNRHKYNSMICRVNVSMRARGHYEISRYYQNPK